MDQNTQSSGSIIIKSVLLSPNTRRLISYFGTTEKNLSFWTCRLFGAVADFGDGQFRKEIFDVFPWGHNVSLFFDLFASEIQLLMPLFIYLGFVADAFHAPQGFDRRGLRLDQPSGYVHIYASRSTRHSPIISSYRYPNHPGPFNPLIHSTFNSHINQAFTLGQGRCLFQHIPRHREGLLRSR